MMSYSELFEAFDQNLLEAMGFSKEQFALLPDCYQRAIIKRFLEINNRTTEKEESQNNIKRKVLSLLKK